MISSFIYQITSILKNQKNNKLSKFDSRFCFSSILQLILYYSMDLKNDWS